MAVAQTAPGHAHAGLLREIGLVGLLWASMGSIIGSGWLFGAQEGLEAAGPAAIFSWIIGGVCMLILALVHAELGGMYPVSGGSARFPHYAFGGVAGASFGWFAYLQAATVAPIEVEAVILYAGHYDFASGWLNKDLTLSGSGIVIAVLLMAVFSSINFLGVRALAFTNSVATWWKVGVPLLVIFVIAITNFHGSNFTAANGFAPDGAHGVLLAVSTSGIIFAYLGFEQADQLAGESSNPKRDIPIAVIGSMVLGIIIYILLQIAFIVGLPGDAIGNTWDATGHGLYTAFTGPWAQLASAISLGWLASILYFDALVSPGGTGLIYTAASSRVSYGLARNGYIPSWFERLNDRRVPWVGVILAFVLGCVCFLPFPSWQSLVGLITTASVLMYAGAPLALGVFRRQLPNADRPFKLPGGEIIAPLAFIVSGLLILWAGWETDWKLGVAILIGYVILVANQVLNLNSTKPILNWRAAQWLPVYLVGMGVIVYLSNFGPLDDPLFGDWWGIAIVAAFSLVIYYWALAVSLSGEDIERMIEEVVLPEEEDIATVSGH